MQAVAGRDPRLGTNGSDHRSVLRSESGGFFMKSLRRFFTRLVSFATRLTQEERLREELEEHIALQAAENLRAGVPPVEARRKAMLKCGGVEELNKNYRAERVLALIADFFQ